MSGNHAKGLLSRSELSARVSLDRPRREPAGPALRPTAPGRAGKVKTVGPRGASINDVRTEGGGGLGEKKM